jgi:predicted  nucleic acid-binding Zn-ribbon protein
MIPNLESLILLQKIDLKITELVQSQSTFPKELSDLEAMTAAAKKAMDSINAKIAALEAEKISILEKAEDAKKSLDKSQERLNSIKTNREYDAVHSEIETFNHVIAGADGRIKNCDTEIEKRKQGLEAANAEYEKVKTENEPKINELKEKIASIDSLIAAQQVERNAIVAIIPKPLLRSYDHILSRKKNGKVLSFVSLNSKKCSSCYKMLETQLINEIRRGTKMITCQNCGAIFIWEENNEPV